MGQHEDWTSEFLGMSGKGTTTPESVVFAWIAEIEDLAVDRANGTIPTGPLGDPIGKVYVTPDGRDLRQLLEKFLRGAVAYSQGIDDYLDDDTEGKGILSPNTRDGSSPYTVLEHQWDEGFGYFGAARDYLDYTDDEVAGSGGREAYRQGFHDTNGDGVIDLNSEFNFGHATNAAKRDRASVVPTNFSAQAMNGFLRGRAIIAAAGESLTAPELADLREARDEAAAGWENAIAATVVHYANAVLRDMSAFGTPGYDFLAHAKHWSELKGFILSLQFSRFSKLDDSQLEQVNDLVGAGPVLPNADVAAIQAYRSGLDSLKDILQTAYGFDAANMGNEQGAEGW
ncbi:MAG: DUF4856 domain-containing protein [Myxococcales bacterium]|nr:DUF4856 domain-containing protein [Myxococcales bacterium]